MELLRIHGHLVISNPGQVLVERKIMVKIAVFLFIAPLFSLAVFSALIADWALNTAKWLMVRLINAMEKEEKKRE